MGERIDRCFSRLAASGRRALIPFFTAGFPSRDSTVPIMHASVAAGADILELGVPFSDPMADGPAIQRSSERALAQGVGLRDVLDQVAQFRERDRDTPVVLMGYANPVERMGIDVFLERAAAVGVDGLIVVDYPPEESDSFSRRATALDIDPIFLLAPTTSAERIDQVLSMARGYVYYVSLRGITGGNLDIDDVVKRVGLIKSRTVLPVGVGFGIRDGQTAAAVARCADAVIIGTRMIQVLDDGDPADAPQRAGVFLAGIRASIDAVGDPMLAHEAAR
jgi:tryptophan synthase alpha chain